MNNENLFVALVFYGAVCLSKLRFFSSKLGLSKLTNQLRRENKILSDTNENLESELNTLLGQLAIPSVRNMIFAVADALISGQPIPGFSGGGGCNSDSNRRWDGRRPDEEEDEYKRRCLMHAVQVARNSQRKTIRR